MARALARTSAGLVVPHGTVNRQEVADFGIPGTGKPDWLDISYTSGSGSYAIAETVNSPCELTLTSPAISGQFAVAKGIARDSAKFESMRIGLEGLGATGPNNLRIDFGFTYEVGGVTRGLRVRDNSGSSPNRVALELANGSSWGAGTRFAPPTFQMYTIGAVSRYNVSLVLLPFEQHAYLCAGEDRVMADWAIPSFIGGVIAPTFRIGATSASARSLHLARMVVDYQHN